MKTEAAEQEAIIPGLGGGKDASSPFATALERILDKVGGSDPRTLYLPRPMTPVWLVADMQVQVSWRRRFIVPDRLD